MCSSLLPSSPAPETCRVRSSTSPKLTAWVWPWIYRPGGARIPHPPFPFFSSESESRDVLPHISLPHRFQPGYGHPADGIDHRKNCSERDAGRLQDHRHSRHGESSALRLLDSALTPRFCRCVRISISPSRTSSPTSTRSTSSERSLESWRSTSNRSTPH